MRGGRMSTAKQSVKELLEKLPDDVSFEEIQYQIYVRQKIERALEELKAGNTLTQEEVEARVKTWFD